jgi:hypothetical protein
VKDLKRTPATVSLCDLQGLHLNQVVWSHRNHDEVLASCIECVKSFGFLQKISGQYFSANKTHEKKAVVDRQGERGRTQENLQLPWSLSAACVSIRCCALGRRSAVLYCKRRWWVKCNCGCT